MKTTDRDEAMLLTTVARALCAEYFRGQIELASPGNTALYKAKVADNWHNWIPQAQAAMDASVRPNAALSGCGPGNDQNEPAASPQST
jgi:hypothetical protein